jgi:hypothetical protein
MPEEVEMGTEVETFALQAETAQLMSSSSSPSNPTFLCESIYNLTIASD